jgi:Ca2+-binding RTX toxin-like protein
MNRVGKPVLGIGALVVLATASAALAGAPLPFIDCTGGGKCTGTPAAEFMQGGDLEDRIFALAGNDEMEGEGAEDVINGGKGRDILEGGDLGDVMRGGPGHDRGIIQLRQGTPPTAGVHYPGFFGDAGNDEMFGGRGNDYLEGEEGRDKFFGGDGKDYLDAINDDTKGTKDKLDCGRGFDRYSALAEDVIADNCEKKVPPFIDL